MEDEVPYLTPGAAALLKFETGNQNKRRLLGIGLPREVRFRMGARSGWVVEGFVGRLGSSTINVLAVSEDRRTYTVRLIIIVGSKLVVGDTILIFKCPKFE